MGFQRVHPPALEGAGYAAAAGMAVDPIVLSHDAVTKSLAGMPKSAALWIQPTVMRLMAGNTTAVEKMVPFFERLLNGDLPPAAQSWVYDHKVIALAKTSHHQADIAERADRILNGSAVSMTEHSTTEARKIRPIAIGKAWLRAAV